MKANPLEGFTAPSGSRWSPRARLKPRDIFQVLGRRDGPSKASPYRRNKSETSKGITLIELMVTLAVLVILLGVAVPTFQSVIRTNRVASLTNALVSALNLARSEAITRGTTVTLCRVDDPGTRIDNDASPKTKGPSCSTNEATGWTNGWLLFVDENGNGTVDDTEHRLKVWQPSSATAASIDGGGDAADTTDGNFDLRVSYLPSGVSRGSIAGNGAGTLAVCSAPDKRRNIVITTTGRIRIERLADASCP